MSFVALDEKAVVELPAELGPVIDIDPHPWYGWVATGELVVEIAR